MEGESGTRNPTDVGLIHRVGSRLVTGSERLGDMVAARGTQTTRCEDLQTTQTTQSPDGSGPRN